MPSTLIVSADAAATANNIRASESLFRMGFAGYLVEAMCDVALTLVLYVLLKPAGRDLALLAAFFRLVSTATFAAGVASILLGYLIFQSGYLPRALGVLLALGGLGFVIRNFVLVLAPAYASSFLLLPMMLAALSLAVWFLARGVDVP